MVQALVLVPGPHSLSKTKEAEGENGTDRKSKITIHTHTHRSMRMSEWAGWPSEPSTPPLTLGDGKKKTKKENSHHYHLHRSGRGREGGGAGEPFSWGQPGRAKENQHKCKRIFRRAKERERAWGGWLVVLRGLWAPTPLALPTGSRLRLAARF